MSKIAMVTGATSGIGKASAYKFAELGYNLIVLGRRNERLEALKAEIEQKNNVKVLSICCDVRNREDVETALSGMDAEWKNIDILLNNAGLAAGMGRINDGDIEDWECMIDTNVKGLLYVSKIVSNFMKERGEGHIINLGSIAGKEVYLNGNVYCATKHAVDALSKAMRMDLLPYGIKVSQICPGAVETEFSMVRFKGDTAKAKAVYQGIDPLTANDIADTIIYMATAPKHVNIADVIIFPSAQGSSSLFERK